MRAIQVLLVLGSLWLGGITMAADILLVFTHEYCGPCQSFKHDMAADENLLANWTVEVFDIKTAKEIAADFNVKTVPCFIVVTVDKDGVINKTNEQRREVGYTSKDKLTRWLNRKR